MLCPEEMEQALRAVAEDVAADAWAVRLPPGRAAIACVPSVDTERHMRRDGRAIR